MVSETRVDRRVREACARLADDFRGIFSIETIERCAMENLETYRESRLQDYIPLLVYRFTRERLIAFAQVEGLMTKDQPEVLFVCVHNAGRSQMASVLTQTMSSNRVHVRSAGSAPGDEINPVVVRAMAEIGLNLSQEFPKPLTDEVVRAADVVITMGCGDACAIYPGKRYEDWEVRDPSGGTIDDVREIRDVIAERVAALLDSLGIEVTSPVAISN